MRTRPKRLSAARRCSRGRRHGHKPDGAPPRRQALKPEASTPEEHQAALIRALKRYRSRLDRKLQAMRGDLGEAERGPEFRRFGEALLSYLRQVPGRASSVTLPDPADSGNSLEIELDPNLNAQGNAARYFKRAAKGERGRAEIPPRLKSSEGWDVLIGRSNEGNDYLTHKLARPEDYWFHVHGAAGSHVVLRRGKGKNEPSKQTIQEVAAWAAHYSQARTAGKVPVIFTRKKYVRKPRGSKPGLAVCEREKTVMVRPVEPDASDLSDAPESGE